MREKLSRIFSQKFSRISLKLHLANSKIIFDFKSFPFLEQFGGNKARSGEVIARRNEFQDKFFLVHSTCRRRDCACASIVGSFSILFTFSRQRQDIGPPHFAIREYSSQYYTEQSERGNQTGYFLFGGTDIRGFAHEFKSHTDHPSTLPAFFRSQSRHRYIGRSLSRFAFQFLVRYEAANFLYSISNNCLYIFFLIYNLLCYNLLYNILYSVPSCI